jgi:hypothetical protein
MPDPNTAPGATPDAGAMPAAGDPSGEPAAATSTDNLGEEGRRALAELRREVKAAQKERDELRAAVRQREEAEQTDLQKATTRAEQAEVRIAELEHRQLQVQVATAAGIPQHWKRLVGKDEDELKADAEELKASLPTNGSGATPAPGDLGAGARTPAPATGSAAFSDTIRRRAKR